MMNERATAVQIMVGPLEPGREVCVQKGSELMAELAPLLRKRAGGRETAGLKAYEDGR